MDFDSIDEVTPIDVRIKGEQVYLKEPSIGDDLVLEKYQSKIIPLALRLRKSANSDDPEQIGNFAASECTPEELEALHAIKREAVFLRWCDENGKRKFTDRKKFNEVSRKVLKAIVEEMDKLDAQESSEEAEKNF